MASYRAKSYKKKRPFVKFLCALAVLLVLCAIAITVSSALDGPLPSWNTLYTWAGLRQNTQLPADTDTQVAVHFIDVGQGVATLLACDGHYALVDAGGTDTAKQLLQYLQDNGVRKLDYLMLSHPHADHVGGMATLVRAIPVGTMVMPDFTTCQEQPNAVSFARLLEVLADKNVPTVLAQSKQQYALGSGVIEVLYEGLVNATDLNNDCTVYKFTAGQLSCVLPGDAEEDELEAMLAEDVDCTATVLAAGHHGSANGNPIGFVTAVDPQYVVVSCGKDNGYGHPHQTALWHFDEVGAAVYRTDTMGTIVATVNAEGDVAMTQLGKVA